MVYLTLYGCAILVNMCFLNDLSICYVLYHLFIITSYFLL